MFQLAFEELLLYMCAHACVWFVMREQSSVFTLTQTSGFNKEETLLVLPVALALILL